MLDPKAQEIVAIYQTDLGSHSVNTSFENCLLFLLSYISRSDKREELRLQLEQLYSYALHICNHPTKDELEPGTKDNSTNLLRNAEQYSVDFRKNLEEYHVNTNKQDRCKTFTQLANTILEVWDLFRTELEDTLGFRRPSDRECLVFQRNDLSPPPSSDETVDDYSTYDSTQKPPDLIALSLSAAVKTRTNSGNTHPASTSWLRLAKEFAPYAPSRALEDYSKMPMSWEFRTGPERKAPPVPQSYHHRTPSECDSKPPLSLTSNEPVRLEHTPHSLKTESGQIDYTSVTVASGGSRASQKPSVSEEFEDMGTTSNTRPSSVGSLQGQGRRAAIADEYDILPAPPRAEASVETIREIPVAIQSAIHATKRLSSSITLAHALTAVVIDEHLWLTWYERGGCIRSSSLNFITDFPYLMVLLVILKYFDDVAWGECREIFSPLKHGKVEFSLGDTKFTTKGWRPSEIALFSRGTNTVPVISESVNPLDPTATLKDMKMVAKFYWPEERRQAEDQLLNYAYAVSSQPDSKRAVRGHLPVLIASASFRTREDTISKRKVLLGFKEDSRFTWQCCRILVFSVLRPIQELTGPDFMAAWLDCFQCHFELWKWGLHHRDISSGNLMYTRDEQGRVVGVLNDFDLSVLAPLAGEFSTERTGTVLFMATDLLLSVDECLPHLYEYDVESFIYVLLWLAHRYGLENGKVKLINPEAYSKWRNGDPLSSIQAHQIALEEARDYVDKLPQSIRAPLRLAHGDYVKTIGDLSSTLLRHKLQREIDRIDGTSSKATLSDLMAH